MATDPATGARLVTVTYPDGSDRLFPQISPADWITLGNTLVATRKQRRRAELQADGAHPAVVAKAVEAIDRRPVLYGDVREFVGSLEGSYHVLRAAFRRDAPGATDEALDAEVARLGQPGGWLTVAAALCGLRTESRPAEDDDSPNPPPAGGEPSTPPAETPSPTTSIGSSSATESASGSGAPTTP